MSKSNSFNLSEYERSFNERYPSFSAIKDFHEKAKYPAANEVYRAWLTEGIPCVFANFPLLFEKIRIFIGNELHIHPSDIKLVGSARTGYSMNPSKSGAPFSKNSDLDLAVVSGSYFSDCEKDFLRFKNDFEYKLIKPKNSNQSKLWPEIIEDIDSQSQERGFIDVFKIPNYSHYTFTQKANNTCWRLTERLNASSFDLKIKKSSIRVYRDTKSFITQNNITFRACFA